MQVPEIRPLTGLRALLALWVVLQHFVRELLPAGFVQQLVAAGHVSVHVFFVLSGYVLRLTARAQMDRSAGAEVAHYETRRCIAACSNRFSCVR